MADRDDVDMLGLIRAAERAFDSADARPPASEVPARRVFEAMYGGQPNPVHTTGNGRRLPACTHLDDAIESARDHGGPVADVAHVVAAIAPHLAWERRRAAEVQTAEFARGHANAVLLRFEHPERDVVLGISLMSPHVRYPDHHHPPEEVYIVLSPGEWRQHQEAWHEPGPGNVVHNPPGIVHAMRSGDAPLLALWLHLDEH